ncbi:MAG TPA: site-2 protease family protein [Tepidisphaeraceae bacterium]|jgi:regulator of sigma E protease|nr:site-2 protease family protein [Tepidisphaeraceae bacterium]
MTIGNVLAIAGLVFGFGFVVFFHELGHFLAAKWVGIKVEQFAVGFGHAILAFRKGLGLRVGSTTKEYERRVKEHFLQKGERKGDLTSAEFSATAAELGLGETEYRLNWMPLGGYVKMLGQDDLNPAAQSDDPRAYNRKSVGARMFVVSAGVIMNVILAAIFFMAVFLMGFNVPPSMVGGVTTNSPAQQAGLQVGDRVRYLDGDYQHDFTKLQLNTALVKPDHPIPVLVERDGKFINLNVRPRRPAPEEGDFLVMGVRPMPDLAGLNPKEWVRTDNGEFPKIDESSQILPGDVITAVSDKAVQPQDYAIFDRALQASGGKPVNLSVRDSNGKTRTVEAKVSFEQFFGDTPFNIAGMEPRPTIEMIEQASPVAGKLMPGDVVEAIVVNGEQQRSPTIGSFKAQVQAAARENRKVDFVVKRKGADDLTQVAGVVPTFRTGQNRRGVGVRLGEEAQPVIANVIADSPAARAGVPRDSLIQKINGKPVISWMEVNEALKATDGNVVITAARLDPRTGKPVSEAIDYGIVLASAEIEGLKNIRYAHELLLRDRIEPRKTSNPFIAAGWGVTETRDLLLQFYLTLQRLAQGSVSAGNLMGPLGIVHAGSKFAMKGNDWLIWFLAMISANLAVVNFLPIPIVDGGLFTFLIIEKIAGKPLSPRMQTVAQLVGMAIILSVFVLVTYQDISRLWL